MKKVWNAPKLEALDVKMTMWNMEGNNHDGAWTEHISNPVDHDGDGEMTEAMMS
ncbi:paeninodin family lasso peptide [Pseudalkalibacillus caeni]|uniref:Paeninodin family lasso peptide n=1 Tax=Exobacillus caeni TaxID=2574798 RepID=A0A5R9EZC7_9BACL|nr:paeninodin family lasso peptide [Pseudalkalibacillus caeni]TLS35556.1 paeninodin family lasso peptide [Pseudalkalibacillus caeni]